MNVATSLDFGLPLLGAVLALLVGYGLWLGRVLGRLERKLERLKLHCQSCRREVADQLAGRLPYDPAHPAGGEAVPDHGRLPRSFSAEDVRIIGGRGRADQANL